MIQCTSNRAPDIHMESILFGYGGPELQPKYNLRPFDQCTKGGPATKPRMTYPSSSVMV